MRRSTLTLVALLCAAIVGVSCSDDKSRPVLPTAPPRLQPSQPNFAFRPGTCFTAATVTTLVRTMLGAGHPATNTALAKLTAMIIFVAQNKIPQAQAAARDLIAFLKSQITPGTPISQKAQIQSTINAILCFVGLPLDTFVLLPSTQPQTVVTGDGHTGVTVPPGAVTVPTTLTITTLDPNGPSGLVTKLDQYPTFVSITSSSQLNQPAVVAICLSVSVPVSVFNRLRLGHQKSSGFEITPPADPSFLNCPISLASASRVPGWLQSVASLVLPKALYARQEELRSGGVGGSATEFSPFDAVDPEFRAGGGVGGSATEFQRKSTLPGLTAPADAGAALGLGAAPGPRLNTVAGGVCTAVAVTVGTAIEPECRPVMTISTAKGTLLTGVPVTWAVATGGGAISPNTVATQTCGATFGTTASTTTNTSGKAGVCWNLGPNGGSNTVIGTPHAGGDAPAGVTFVPVSTTFTAAGIKITPTAGATGASVTFDGLPHPGSGTCSNGLVPALTYSGSGSVPMDAGSYTLTVKCGTGSLVYNEATASAAITIAPAPTTTTVTCSVASVPYNGSAQAPCSANVTGAGGLNLSPTPSYSANTNVGTATASYTYPAGGNYLGSSGSKSFAITTRDATATAGSGTKHLGQPDPVLACVVTGLLAADAGTVTCTTTIPATPAVGSYVTTPSLTTTNPNYAVGSVTGTLIVTPALYAQVGCFSRPLSSALPPESSGITKGAVIEVECQLANAAGAPVMTATGDLLVQDRGTDGSGTPVTVVSLTNAFHAWEGGVYTSNLETAAAGFVAGHYYFVVATWNDGSTTSGWFLLK